MTAKITVKSLSGDYEEHLEFATNQEAADVMTSYANKPFNLTYKPIGVPVEEDELRQAVIDEAITWLNTPFHMNGAIKGEAIDCGHFLAEVYRSIGIAVPEVTEQFRIDWHMHERTERYLNLVTPYTRQVEEPRPGDIVMFKVARVYAHSGVIVKWPLIIHAKWGSGVQYTDVSIDGDLKKRSRIFLTPFGVEGING